MSEFSVNTDKVNSLADLLENQAKTLENAGGSIDSVRNCLSIQGAARASVMSAMQTTSNNVKEEAQAAVRMGSALRQIAAAYRNTERGIAGFGNGNGGSGYGGNGGNGSGGNCGGQNGDNKDSGAYSKDPVNLNTGNFILDNTDMEIPGAMPLVLGRFYNSMGTFSGMLGADWNTSFEMRLFKAPEHHLTGTDICIMLGDGREEYFILADGKQYIPVSDSTAELKREENGFVYQNLAGERYCFDEKGLYTRYENAHHIGFNLIYADGNLKKVEKDSGEFYAFSYQENGLLGVVEDHTGRKCQYTFENGQLKSVELPDNSIYQYSYNTYGKISRVVNPRGIGAVETEYDDLHRAVYQKFADGTTNRFEYRDAEMAVIMTERNGTKSIHYHNEKYQNVRNVYSDGEESFTYNERGQKTSITDKLGNVTQLQYDNRGNITGILTADKTKISATYNQQNRLLTLSVNGKNKVRNQYNSYGDLLCQEDGLGRKTNYIYDENGRMVKVQMPDQSLIHAVYDERGNISGITDEAGGNWKFAYDERNQLTDQVTPLGQKNSCKYDVMGRLLSLTRADGNSKSYTYDEWGNIVSEKDFDGSVVTTAYNENNKPVLVVDKAQRQTHYEYDSMWNVSKAILPGGMAFQYLYDENNHLKTIKDALDHETHYTYDAVGNVISRIDAKGNCTAYEWDSNGRCIKITDAKGYSTEYRYDEDGQLIYVKDAEGVELLRNYDAAGQLVREQDSLGKTRTYTYNAAGDVVAVTDEKGLTTAYTYAKGLHKVSEVLYPDSTRELYTYDAAGNHLTYTDRYGNTLSYKYDILDRLLSVTKENGKSMTYEYDLLGKILCETDFDGNSVRYSYTPSGQLASLTDGLGNTTFYTYDGMDELISVRKAVPDTSQVMELIYERNAMEQITKVTDALGRTETYQYDSLGKMVEKTDRSGRNTSYTYDSLGLLKGVKWADGRVASYEYTPLRRLREIQDWTGTTRMKYDGMGNLLEIEYPDKRTLSYIYDGVGNRVQMVYPDGKAVSYTYDALGRMREIIQEEGAVSYSYDKYGNVSERTLPDGTAVRYQYDKNGALSRMTYQDQKGILDEFTFGYDEVGRRNTYGLYRRDIPGENGQYAYSYDGAGHLSQIRKNQQLLREYQYDSFGNRKSRTDFDLVTGQKKNTSYTYDLSGALLKMVQGNQIQEFGYDQRGNLTEQRQNGKILQKYQYDALNRLERAENARGEASTYAYNGLGYRIGMEILTGNEKQTVSYTLDYSRIYDNLVESTENQERENYLWGLGLEGSRAASIAGWYLTDPLGSVLRKTEEGKTRYSANYDEFGNVLSSYGEDCLGYNGFMYDKVAGTWFAQARQYRSNTGTFDGMDRFGGDITMPDTLNPYVYCLGDGFSHTDKSGYWCGVDDLIAAGLGAIGGAAGQFIGDVIDSAASGEFHFSSWQEYTGAAIGGAAGGVTTLYAGPIAGGAVASGTSKLTTEGLTWASDPSAYDKSFGQVAKETVWETGKGALAGAASEFMGKGMEKLANTKWAKSVMSKLQNNGKLGSFLADKISDIARGKSGKRWDVITDFLKLQHNNIKNSPALTRKLFSLLLHGLPIYVGQELWDSTKGTIKDKIKELLGGKLKDLLWPDSASGDCAATTCAVSAGGR